MPKKTTIDDLREHLFAAIEDLRDPESKVDLERIKMVRDLAGTIIESAKVEVSMVEAISGVSTGSSFFGNIPEESRELPFIKERKKLTEHAA